MKKVFRLEIEMYDLPDDQYEDSEVALALRTAADQIESTPDFFH